MPAADKPQPQPPPEPILLELARKKFTTLSRAVEELVQAAQEGRVASALTGNEKEDNPANAANWNANRVVRAEGIAWLCTDPQASALVTYRGLKLCGMRVDADLDLNNAEVKFSLDARKCAFSGNVLLQDAQIRGLYLEGCLVKSLSMGRAKIRGAVLLRNGFKADGEVGLLGTTIDGDLYCGRGVQLSNASGLALNAAGMKVGGSVFLRNGFKADGEVSLLGTTIDGDLDCSGAQLSNANGSALNAAGMKVGYVFLRNGFKAKGEVSLEGTTIDGNLECDGAQFSNANGKALFADGMRVGGSIFFRNGFKAEGFVSLVGADLGRLLVCSGLVDPEKAILDLELAKTGTLWDDKESWPSAGKLFLDGFNYERLFERSPLDAKSRIDWLHRQPRLTFLPQPYEQLAAVFRQMGREREARLVMIGKNRDRAKFTRFLRQGWWWYNLLGRAIEYGYAPWRAFVGSVLIILLGWFLFAFGFSHDLISPAKEGACAKDSQGQFVLDNSGRPKIFEDYPVFNPFVYSLESFIPLIKFDQSASWTPNANRGMKISIFRRPVQTGALLRYYLYCHITIGWLLTSLWVGAVTGLIKS